MGSRTSCHGCIRWPTHITGNLLSCLDFYLTCPREELNKFCFVFSFFFITGCHYRNICGSLSEYAHTPLCATGLGSSKTFATPCNETEERRSFSCSRSPSENLYFVSLCYLGNNAPTHQEHGQNKQREPSEFLSFSLFDYLVVARNFSGKQNNVTVFAGGRDICGELIKAGEQSNRTSSGADLYW